jgi:hypothetical protein
MTYTATNWVEGVTTLGPTNMNKIETGIATVSGLDQLAAAQRIVWATDTNLYRSAAGWVKTDGSLFVGRLRLEAATDDVELDGHLAGSVTIPATSVNSIYVIVNGSNYRIPIFS